MLKCSILFIMKEIIIFMTACKLVISNYKGLYNVNIWMSTALWGISGNELKEANYSAAFQITHTGYAIDMHA